MAAAEQYLRLRISGCDYLLPSAAGYTIEQRDNLQPARGGGGPVVAWRAGRGGGRGPAYALDARLRPVRREDWQRAVFIGTRTDAVGVVVDEVQLMPRDETTVTPFTPLGPPATRWGHLFTGAWVQGAKAVLVFDPQAFAGYLQSLGE